MEFKAVPRTILDALDLKRKYVIPRFQREYSWESDELDDLWDDLLENFKYVNGKLNASEYFIGSLVLVGDDDDLTNIERQIVDGQQRFMTFTIAFSVLCQCFKKIGENKLSEKTHCYIIGEDADGNTYTKVISESPKPFFQYRIQQKDIDFTVIPTTKEEKRILSAYKYFERKLNKDSYLKELSDKFPGVDITYTDALRLFRDQILNCKVIYVTVKSFDDAYTIFEVLNAKGKDLTPVDIIKNSIFNILDQQEPIDMAHEKWESIRKSMAEGEIDDILTFYRHFWISKYGLTTTKKLVKDFNSNIKKTQEAYGNFLNELAVAAKDYAEISSPNYLHWLQPEYHNAFYSLEAISIFGVTQVRTFLLALFESKRENMISQKDYLRIFDFLEYFHFVFNAVCSERPSGMERRYSSYARKLRESTDKQKARECIKDLMSVLNESLPSYDQFENHFIDIRYTSRNTKSKKLLQYILRKLENYSVMSNELKPDSFSIEHILPESTRNDSVGMIGNMLPLGVELNNSLND
jgi:uncharacterized protein with ParB-like and HNH nuclease domain